MGVCRLLRKISSLVDILLNAITLISLFGIIAIMLDLSVSSHPSVKPKNENTQFFTRPILSLLLFFVAMMTLSLRAFRLVFAKKKELRNEDNTDKS